jgi:hypothetical protein
LARTFKAGIIDQHTEQTIFPGSITGSIKGMATLKSEDEHYQSSIKITAGKVLEITATSEVTRETQKQSWQLFDLEMKSGPRNLTFKSDQDQSSEDFTTVSEVSVEDRAMAVESLGKIPRAYALCRKPSDELDNLAKMLEELAAEERAKLSFEPSEPSFELTITNVAGGFQVELFVDAGNVETGIYRWDSLGIRFFTTAAKLKSFHDELKAEFHC